MLGLNILRHPPGHRAGFVNEWVVNFFHRSEENFRVHLFHTISSCVDYFTIGSGFYPLPFCVFIIAHVFAFVNRFCEKYL